MIIKVEAFKARAFAHAAHASFFADTASRLFDIRRVQLDRREYDYERYCLRPFLSLTFFVFHHRAAASLAHVLARYTGRHVGSATY